MEASPSTLVIRNDASVVYRYIAPKGHTLHDCTSPTYWRHVSRDLSHRRYRTENPWHKIEIIADDGTWEAELRVVSVDADGLVTTRVISSWSAPAKRGKGIPDGYKVEHINGQGWRALAPDGSVLASNKAVEDDAVLCVLNHAKRAA